MRDDVYFAAKRIYSNEINIPKPKNSNSVNYLAWFIEKLFKKFRLVLKNEKNWSNMILFLLSVFIKDIMF